MRLLLHLQRWCSRSSRVDAPADPNGHCRKLRSLPMQHDTEALDAALLDAAQAQDTVRSAGTSILVVGG